MAKSLFFAGLIVVAAAVGTAPRCSGTPNTYPVWNGNATFVTKVTNGLKFTAQPNSNYSNPTAVIHVYGTQYEMGYAYGQLMAAEIQEVIPEMHQYVDELLNKTLPSWIPEDIKEFLLTKGIDIALNLTYELTKPYTPSHHYDTLQGMADGSGMDYGVIARISMIPELVKASCSMMGAWGAATAQTSCGLVQLRALDWNTDGPFQKYPTLITWHPEEGNGVPFTVLTWAGLLGAITGMSSSGMGISEKLWYNYDGPRPMNGYVWNFLLQDILQFDQDADTALGRVASANRTCSFFIGMGDSTNNFFKIVPYSLQQVMVWNDKNFPSYPNHDLFTNLLFLNKDTQPSNDPCFNDLMHTYYGQLSPQTVITQVTALEQTGNMHIAVMDFKNHQMYISNASPADQNGNCVPAYARPFMQFDAQALWNTKLSDY